MNIVWSMLCAAVAAFAATAADALVVDMATACPPPDCTIPHFLQSVALTPLRCSETGNGNELKLCPVPADVPMYAMPGLVLVHGSVQWLFADAVPMGVDVDRNMDGDNYAGLPFDVQPLRVGIGVDDALSALVSFDTQSLASHCCHVHVTGIAATSMTRSGGSVAWFVHTSAPNLTAFYEHWSIPAAHFIAEAAHAPDFSSGTDADTDTDTDTVTQRRRSTRQRRQRQNLRGRKQTQTPTPTTLPALIVRTAFRDVAEPVTRPWAWTRRRRGS
jgi:hypothetical protein